MKKSLMLCFCFVFSFLFIGFVSSITYNYGDFSFPTQTSDYLSIGSSYTFDDGSGGIGTHTIEAGKTGLHGESFSDYNSFFVSEGNLFGVYKNPEDGSFNARVVDCAGACYGGTVNNPDPDGSEGPLKPFDIGTDSISLDSDHPNYNDHVEKLNEMNGEDSEVCDDQEYDGEESTNAGGSGGETTEGGSEHEIEDPQTLGETKRENGNTEREAIESGEGDENKFACRVNTLLSSNKESGEDVKEKDVDSILKGFGNMDEEKRGEVVDALEKEGRQNFLEALGKRYGDVDLSGVDDFDLVGEGSENLALLPSGIDKKHAVSLDSIRSWNNVDGKGTGSQRAYTSVHGGEKKDAYQPLTGVSVDGDNLKYSFDGGRVVNVNKGSSTTFDLETMQANLGGSTKDSMRVDLYGNSDITIGENGGIEFTAKFDDKYRTSFGRIGGENGRMVGSAQHHAPGVQAGAEKPTEKGTYNHWGSGSEVYSVDQHGIVRKYNSGTLIPSGEESYTMDGGFISDPLGNFFPATTGEGTHILGTGSDGTGNFFSSDGKGGVSIHSDTPAWFTQNAPIERLKLTGADVTVKNGGTLIRTKNEGELSAHYTNQDGTIKGNVFFREAFNPDKDPTHAIGNLNDVFSIRKEQDGTFSLGLSDGTGDRLTLTQGSLTQAIQGRTPPQTTTENVPDTPTEVVTGGTGNENGNGKENIPQLSSKYAIRNNQAVFNNGQIFNMKGKSKDLVVYGTQKPSNIPQGALIMVSGGVNCPGCITLKNYLKLDEGYNSNHNIYLITQPDNSGEVPRFYQD